MDYNEHEQRKPARTAQIGKLIEESARRFAAFLSRQSERLSTRQKKIIALVFGLLAVVASVSLLLSPLTTPSDDSVLKGDSVGRAQSPAVPHATSSRDNKGVREFSAGDGRDSFHIMDPVQSMRMLERWLRSGLDSLAGR